MGQKSSRTSHSNQYLMPLPFNYVRNGGSELYSLKTNQFVEQQQIDGSLDNSQHFQNKQLRGTETQNKGRANKQINSNNFAMDSEFPSFLKHYIIMLNKIQIQPYLNHLVYRNKPQFKQLFAQAPFGEIQTHEKYTKVHLYAQDIFLTLNQVSNIPFNDMCIILYTSLIAYRLLYQQFGLFKIQGNMIGFTRDSKVKVWLNHKLIKDKPLPIVSDINLKRYKQEESYMVDDLLNIFWNKVDRDTIPNDFNLLCTFSNIRNSRLSSSRLNFSRVLSEKDLSQSMINSLQNNLILDFSDRSFDKCLQYLDNYLLIERPQFISQEPNDKDDQQKAQQIQTNTYAVNRIRRKHVNFLPSISNLIKTRKQVAQATDFRNSKVNVNINLKVNNYKPRQMVDLSYQRPQVNSFSTQLSVPSSKINFKYTNSVSSGISIKIQQKSNQYLKPALQKKSQSVYISPRNENSKQKMSFRYMLPEETLSPSHKQKAFESVRNKDQRQNNHRQATHAANSPSNPQNIGLNSLIARSHAGHSFAQNMNRQNRSISGPIDSNVLSWKIQEQDGVVEPPITNAAIRE